MQEYFSGVYFVIQIMLNALFIITYMSNYKRIEGLQEILLYSAITLAECLFGAYLTLFSADTQAEALLEHSMNLFMLIEFIIFYLFLIRSIRSRFFTRILKTIIIIFPAMILYHWTARLHSNSAAFVIMEAYLIIIPCLFYYYELFRIPTPINLLREPRLWAISGILFLFILLAPLFLQGPALYIAANDLSSIYVITFIGYIILFIFFIAALICQMQIRK